MIQWLLFWASGNTGAASSITLYTGILHPIVDTAGDFDTNTDPDRTEVVRNLSTALNPTD